MKAKLGASGFILFAVVLVAPYASANHLYGTYRSRGYLWLATNIDYAHEWVTSSKCNAQEVGGFTRVTNSTANTSEFAGRWPSGLKMTQETCDSVVNNFIDIDIEYSDYCVTHVQNGVCQTYGGENHYKAAPSSFCAYWFVTAPCGAHPSTVHMNLNKWNIRSNLWREREVMHETSHSNGLAHHCSADSITNDGTSTCNNGRWTEVMVYKPIDRAAIKSVYPNWRYS